jgi:hypothetical protein
MIRSETARQRSPFRAVRSAILGIFLLFCAHWCLSRFLSLVG